MQNRITEYHAVLTTYPYPKDAAPPMPGEMHVLEKDGIPEMVNFLCPCGCGRECPTHVVTMQEKQQQRGAWTASCWGFDPATITIFPSIRYLGGCKTHFNITNGKVVMHADSGR